MVLVHWPGIAFGDWLRRNDEWVEGKQTKPAATAMIRIIAYTAYLCEVVAANGRRCIGTKVGLRAEVTRVRGARPYSTMTCENTCEFVFALINVVQYGVLRKYRLVYRHLERVLYSFGRTWFRLWDYICTGDGMFCTRCIGHVCSFGGMTW